MGVKYSSCIGHRVDLLSQRCCLQMIKRTFSRRNEQSEPKEKTVLYARRRMDWIVYVPHAPKDSSYL